MSYCRDWEQNNYVPAIIFLQLHNVIKFVHKPVVDWHAEHVSVLNFPPGEVWSKSCGRFIVQS